MPPLKYENLRANTTNLAKCYVGYILINPDGSRERRKEYGKKNYNISIAKVEGKEAKEAQTDILLVLVRKSLEAGIDPQNAAAERDKENIRKIEEAKLHASAKIPIDDAIQMCIKEKGWQNPVESKKISSSNILRFFRTQFKPYLIAINKSDDIREVKMIDIKKYIDLHFNPTEGSGYGEWSTASCLNFKGFISILFGVLVEHNLMEHNPAKGIKIKPNSEKINKAEGDDFDRFEPWTEKEIEIWFKELKNGTDRERVICISSHLLYYAFIRRSEFLRMKVWMIDFENERITLPPSLTKSARKYNTKTLINLDMPDALVTALKDWIDYKYPNGWTDDDFLIPNHKTATTVQFSYLTFTEAYRVCRERMQVRYPDLFIDKNQYALKHSGVIKLFNALSKSNKTPQEIQNIVRVQCRHSSFLQTETYLRKLHLEFKGKREKINF